MNTIGQKLRRSRLALGLGIESLGMLLEVSGNTIARWERGEVIPQSEGMLFLAIEALQIRNRLANNKRLRQAVERALEDSVNDKDMHQRASKTQGDNGHLTHPLFRI